MNTSQSFFPDELALEEALSRPTGELDEMFSKLDGDILFLGVSGKMGISMACMARRACELTEFKKYQMLDTLSVAYAAAGRFDEAVKAAEQALKLARSAEPLPRQGPGQADSGADIQERLELFRAGRPYRESQ